MRPPVRPPHSQKSKQDIVDGIISTIVILHVLLLVSGVGCLFVFSVNEKLYNLSEDAIKASECTAGAQLSAYIILYSFIALIIVLFLYDKIIEPKLRKDH
ncbi:hypothetical protein DW886_16905 [Enterocloster aldenensis]|uniref:hypothetical protein n=1 Tax=Enterocloster aldenensis TaxID=358742 RepID=UPI000E5519BE|nr:hypothetical protein DW886_16905 [Enterocloster aldenensis]